MKTVLFLILSGVILTGCATGPRYAEYSAAIKPVQNDEGRIWFYRPSKMIGAAVQPQVRINDVPVGKAQPGCFFFVDRPAGNYEIKLSTEWASKCQVNVARNSVNYVRLTIGPGVFVGHVIPSIESPEKALKEIEECRHYSAEGASEEIGNDTIKSKEQQENGASNQTEK